MHAIIAAMLIAPSLSAIVTGGLGNMLHLGELVILRHDAGKHTLNVPHLVG